MRKELKKIAKELYSLEKRCPETDKDEQEKYFEKMTKLVENLSVEDLIEIDEYMLSKYFE